MWTPLVHMQVNNAAHLLLLACALCDHLPWPISLTSRTMVWWWARMMKGFVSLSSSSACLMRLPTLSKPLLSMIGFSFKSGLCDRISPTKVMHFSSSWYTSCCTLLMIIFSAFRRLLTDKPFEHKCQPVHWLAPIGLQFAVEPRLWRLLSCLRIA